MCFWKLCFIPKFLYMEELGTSILVFRVEVPIRGI